MIFKNVFNKFKNKFLAKIKIIKKKYYICNNICLSANYFKGEYFLVI